MSKPDFLCIGTQKSGTTWLYENLAKHHQVWSPPIKEFHYFNRVCMNDQLLGDWELPIPKAGDMYWQSAKRLSIKELRWLHRYYYLGLKKDWYQDLFSEEFKQGKICGDITPGYCTLEERGVEYAKKVIGKDTPVIFIIRNPVDRAWSAAKMIFRYHNLDLSEQNHGKIIELLNSPKITLCSEYSRIIPLWAKHFSNFHILTYDEIKDAPHTFLSKISTLLNIENKWSEESIKAVVWGDAKKTPRSENINQHLLAQYDSELSKIGNLVDSPYVEQWL